MVLDTLGPDYSQGAEIEAPISMYDQPDCDYHQAISGNGPCPPIEMVFSLYELSTCGYDIQWR